MSEAIQHNVKRRYVGTPNPTVDKDSAPGQTDRVYALVDCNNFYASCERLFNPKLRGQPIVVLSSNDGCIVARSNEAKDLGIAMGEPYFEFKETIKRNNVHVFSSNYALYGDISRRVMTILSGMAPEMEIYSIDEAFLDLSDYSPTDDYNDLLVYARAMRDEVFKCTGIPVSIGIGRSKTLAKAANHLVKKSSRAKGVLNLVDVPFMDEALAQVPVQGIWGVGRRSAKWLLSQNIYTAKDLRDMNEITLEHYRGIVGLKLIRELKGISCYTMETCPPPSKGVLSSRSFGHRSNSYEAIQGAVATHITIASKKLRDQRSAANVLRVFLLKRYSNSSSPKEAPSASMRLPRASNNAAFLIGYAMKLLEKVFEKDCTYTKAGVMLDDFVPEDQVQGTLFTTVEPTSKRLLMETIDRLNVRLGRGTIRHAVQIPAHEVHSRVDYISPHYTTNWAELAVVLAK